MRIRMMEFEDCFNDRGLLIWRGGCATQHQVVRFWSPHRLNKEFDPCWCVNVVVMDRVVVALAIITFLRGVGASGRRRVVLLPELGKVVHCTHPSK